MGPPRGLGRRRREHREVELQVRLVGRPRPVRDRAGGMEERDQGGRGLEGYLPAVAREPAFAAVQHLRLGVLARAEQGRPRVAPHLHERAALPGPRAGLRRGQALPRGGRARVPEPPPGLLRAGDAASVRAAVLAHVSEVARARPALGGLAGLPRPFSFGLKSVANEGLRGCPGFFSCPQAGQARSPRFCGCPRNACHMSPLPADPSAESLRNCMLFFTRRAHDLYDLYHPLSIEVPRLFPGRSSSEEG
mmetsp:Transcript_10076/g.27398  ORF Transcript_10076/g.27398 Transcript_10076/m.27398 type:complete len:249 (+) Transcript_10076:314-1060(+)